MLVADGVMTRGIIIPGIIPGIALTGIVHTAGAGVGVVFTAAGIHRGIMTGIGARLGAGVVITAIMAAIMAAGMVVIMVVIMAVIGGIIITTDPIIATSTGVHPTVFPAHLATVTRIVAPVHRERVRLFQQEEVRRLTAETLRYEAVAPTRDEVFH